MFSYRLTRLICSFSVGRIVGYVIGSIAGVCILVGLCCCCCCGCCGCCRGSDSHTTVVHQANTPSVTVVNTTNTSQCVNGGFAA
ncbi:hypothetical protein V1264_019780 [Littorina saxatilis]|uniref:Uncharacterized protein n=1 Tax=Littorina saxatilis TaxID=31220 RepID=A0AAN9B8S9_9CAEN